MKGNDVRSILAACDFSSDANYAARRAAHLACEHGAQLKLMTVIRESVLEDLRRHLGAQSDAAQRILEWAKQDVDALAAQLQKIAQASERMVRNGDVVNELLAAADHSDVLVLGAHGLSPTRDAIIGTTAERLLRKGRRPMIVVRTEPREPYQRVFVPVDFSLHSFNALEFAARIAPEAHLHVFHAFDNPYEGLLRRADISDVTIRDLQTHLREEAQDGVKNLLAKSAASAARTSSSVMPGNPRHVVHKAATDWGADLIVLGKQGRSAVGEFFLGGVTRHTLSRAECDVAVIPDHPRP